MTPHKRVLFLGPTGVDKSAAASRLMNFVEKNWGHSIQYVDFENDFLKKHIARHSYKTWTSFLAADLRAQSSIWRTAWEEFSKTLGAEITILGLHATYVSGIMGLRCPIHVPDICESFKPTLIVSLIDDVQNMWRRTEERAGGKDLAGRPTFEQLLSARRAEQILGDMIVTHSQPSDVRHVVCATGNALVSLANLTIFDADVTYMSFPISVPMEMAKNGDRSFIELINRAHQIALTVMQKEHARAFITPLSIDELPLLELKSGEDGNVVYDCASGRWNQNELWGDPDAAILPMLKDGFKIPIAEQIKPAEGAMRTDVGWRDRRLVLQSRSLAIVCPKDPNKDRITRGVRDEIGTAIAVGTPCFYWQNPEWDKDGFVQSQFPSAGSMGPGLTELLVQRVDSLDALLSAKP